MTRRLHDWEAFPEATVLTPGFRCRRCGLINIGSSGRTPRWQYVSSIYVGTSDGGVAERLADGSPFAIVLTSDPGCSDVLDTLIKEALASRNHLVS